MMENYAGYIELDENYSSEINPYSIQTEDWRKTYPHKSFIDYLNTMTKMILRVENMYKKSIMTDGSFGIGKSRIIWTSRMLLTCSDEDFEAYFDSYENLRNEPDLKERMRKVRSKKNLIISRYSDTGADMKEFIIKVYDSVYRELEEKGYSTNGGNSLRGKISEWLSDDDNKKFFAGIVSKTVTSKYGVLGGKNIDDIITDLKDSSKEVNDLIKAIVEISKERGIVAFSFSMKDLADWIESVIDENQLDSIIFFWDEFSTFFKRNANDVDTLQSLVEISKTKPFYFVIAVHSAEKIKNAGDSFSAISDRFIKQHIEMPDNVAFEMIKHFIKRNEIRESEYETLISDIISVTETSRTEVCKAIGIKESLLTGILPIHPMAALVLKHISVEFASNQRSMFNFIKNDDSDNLQAFQWFIKTKSPENGDILTVDYLWNFFYEKGTDEHTDGTGRTLLSMQVSAILDTFKLNEKKLVSNGEKRVLKTILMLQAVSKALNNGVDLLRPSVKNLKLCFEGDDTLEDIGCKNCADNLVKNHIINFDDSLQEYVIVSFTAENQEKVNNKRDELIEKTKTQQLVDTFSISRILPFKGAMKARYDVHAATVDTLTTVSNKAINVADSSYKEQIVICFAKDDIESGKLNKAIKEKINETDGRYKRIIYIDASSETLGQTSFEQWALYQAQSIVANKIQDTVSLNCIDDAKKVLEEWESNIKNGKFIVYAGDFYRPCDSFSILTSALNAYLLSIYPYTFDHININENCVVSPNRKYSAMAGLTLVKVNNYTDVEMQKILGEVKGVEKYWEVYPDNTVSKLKVKVDEFVQKELRINSRVLVSEVFDFLRDDYGFIPISLYTFMTSFLLREYASSDYRYSIGYSGDTGGIMTNEKYIEFIVNATSDDSKKKQYNYIEVMTKDQKAFVDFVVKTFNISDDVSVEIAAVKLRTNMRDSIGYPIWCLKTIDQDNLGYFIDKISSIMHIEDNENVAALSSQFGKKLLEVDKAEEKLVALITKENANKAMNEYLASFENGEILTLATEIGITDVLDKVKIAIGSGNASWLWNEEAGKEELRKLIIKYKIIKLSNRIIGKTSTSIKGTFANWKVVAGQFKLPNGEISKNVPMCKKFIGLLMEICKKGDLDPFVKYQDFLNELESCEPVIASLGNEVEKIIKTSYSKYIDGFTDEQIKVILAKLPESSFMDSLSDYETVLKNITDGMKQKQSYFKLQEEWRSRTNSDSPKAWSDNKGTPIKVMIDKGDTKAELLLNVLANLDSNKDDIETALQYIQTNPEFIERLNDDEYVDDMFAKHILGKYSNIIKEYNVIRKELKEIAADVYNWYGNPSITEYIKSKAVSDYRTGSNKSVIEIIEKMEPQKVKEYLISLVKDNVDVGIEIIIQGGE